MYWETNNTWQSGCAGAIYWDTNLGGYAYRLPNDEERLRRLASKIHYTGAIWAAEAV